MKFIIFMVVFGFGVFAGADDYDCSMFVNQKENKVSNEQYCRYISYFKVVDMSENHKTNTKYFVSELNDDKRSSTMKLIIDNADTCYSTCINKNTKKY